MTIPYLPEQQGECRQSSDRYERGKLESVERANPEQKRYATKAYGCFQRHRIISATNPCVAQENGVGKFLVAALAFGNPSQPRSKCAVGAYYGCAAVLPVVSGRLRETTRHRVRRPRLTFTGRLSAACLPLLLAACATPTGTRSCLTQKQYEQLKAAEPPRIHDKLTGKADEDTRPLAGSALELRSWGHAMLDTLKICSTP